MNTDRRAPFGVALCLIALGIVTFFSQGNMALADTPGAAPKITEKSFAAANNLQVSVRMLAPYAAQVDLQTICVFQHEPSGDKYLASMKDLDEKLGGLLSSLRDRGEFGGTLGETLLLKPPADSIPAKRLLVIGLGPEKDLSLDSLRVAGRVASREAMRLHAKNVAFAPTIRDQGDTTIDVGDGDRTVAEQVVLAYDTEKRLQAEGLADAFSIRDWTIEAGPTYVEAAIEKVGDGVESASAEAKARVQTPYHK